MLDRFLAQIALTFGRQRHGRVVRFAGAGRLLRRPSKDQQLHVLNQTITVMGVFNTIFTLPQILALYGNRDASSLSLLSWSYYLAFSIVLLVYGVLSNQKPLIITYGSGVLAYAIIVFGVILYS